MADALCGPSNALQSFQKHTSVDRTLQQDRLALRQSPTQGFRSPQPNAGILDAEFEAFQAGHPFGAGLPTFEQPQYEGPATASGHDFLHPQLPDWVSDFQSLHLGEAQSSPMPQSQFRQEAPLQRNLPGVWQQDFTRQQGRQTMHQQPIQQQFNGFGQSMYQARSYPMLDGASSQLPSIGQLKQSQQEDVFDEEAFERAFEAAKVLEVEELRERQWQKIATYNGKRLAALGYREVFGKELEEQLGVLGNTKDRQALEDYQMLLEMRNKKRLLAARERREMEQKDRQALDDYQMQLKLLEVLNKKRLLAAREQREMEQKQQVDVKLGKDMLINESADLLARSDHLVEQERIGSDRILHQDEDQRADTQLHDEADDLARTAGQLLDSVKHDQSQKFQESNFLALMRQLRDREVRVEGDRMIDAMQPLHPGGPDYPRDRDTTMTGVIDPDDCGADKANATA